MRVSKEFKVGLLVVLGLLLIYVLVNVLKGESVFGSDREFYAEFNNSSGLEPSNAVLINGVKIGQVTSVDLHPQKPGKVLVKFSVQNDELQIANTSEVWLISSDILGTKALDIRLDTLLAADPEYYEPGDYFITNTEQTLEEQINEQILPLKKKTEDLIASVDGIVVSIKSFWDTSAAYSIEEGLYEVRDAIGQFGELADNLSQLINKETEVIDDILTDIHTLTGPLSQKADTISKILDNLSAVSDTLKNSNLGSTIREAEVALGEFSGLLEKVNNGEGSIGKLMNTDELHNELMKTNIALQNLLNDMEDNPNKYVHFSLLGRKVKGYSTTQERVDILDDLLDSLQYINRNLPDTTTN